MKPTKLKQLKRKALLAYLKHKSLTIIYRTVLTLGITYLIYLSLKLNEPLYAVSYSLILGALIGAHLKWIPEGRAERLAYIDHYINSAIIKEAA